MDEFFGDTESWGLALGFISPLAIAVVQQPRWSPTVRWVVGWACALIVGLITCLARGDLDGTTVLRTVVLTVLAAQAAYGGWSKGPAAVIERATSPRHAAPPRQVH